MMEKLENRSKINCNEENTSLPVTIILGAGRPSRGTQPAALQETPGTNRRALDWLIYAHNSRVSGLHYVGGYKVDEVARAYPDLTYSINTNWRTTGSVGSLLIAPLDKNKTYLVSYSDVVYTGETIDRLLFTKGDVVICIDRSWRDRYEGRTTYDRSIAELFSVDGDEIIGRVSENDSDESAEFIGLLRLSPLAVREVIRLREESDPTLDRSQIPDLVIALRNAGLSVRAIDVGNDWAELNAPQDLSRFVLGTKAHTLARLAPVVESSVIGSQVRFNVKEWRSNSDDIIKKIGHIFKGCSLAVRSSSLNEDNWKTSNAGVFESVLNIDSSDSIMVRKAIERVITSYNDAEPRNEILIQEMVKEVRVSGVAFTRTLTHGASYYQINYDDVTSSTESVTNGRGTGLKTLVVHRSEKTLVSKIAPVICDLIPALEELEKLVGHDALDVEFAIDNKENIHILQLRPIAVDHGAWAVDDELVSESLEVAVASFHAKQTATPFTAGRRTIFGVMPDWNPAEIIGIRPRQLAVSLYRYLIMDETWAQQRVEYGYRDVRPSILLTMFSGHPYVDVRASLTSFVPKSIPEKLAERLVEYYMDRLETHPQFHDKVEFEVAITCASFDLTHRLKSLIESGFSESEIALLTKGLVEVTNIGIERYDRDLEQIDSLSHRFDRIMSNSSSPLETASVLLEDCRRYGALPFAHLARGAFVAVSFLRSMVTAGIASEEQIDAFLRSLNTIAKSFTRDAAAVATGSLDWTDFIDKYGHLRPGTYEVTSPSYRSNAEIFLRPAVEGAEEVVNEHFQWPQEIANEIECRLIDLGIPCEFEDFERFMRRTIEGREFAKFCFTRNLSVALDLLDRYGGSLGMSTDEISHVDITDFLAIRAGLRSTEIGSWLRQRAEEGAQQHHIAQSIELPPLLVRERDFFAFLYPESQANYIGSKSVRAEVIHLESGMQPNYNIADKIVLIPQADPGWDWLFGHHIKGLVTQYGGANSHMAIRAAELGLPAAIGVGEATYLHLAEVHLIELDCQNCQIRIIQ